MQEGRRQRISVQLTRRVLILSAIVLVTILLGAAAGVGATTLIVQRDLSDASHQAARDFDVFFAEVQADLGSVSQSLYGLGDAELDSGDVQDVLRRSLERRPAIFELMLVDPDGQMIAGRRQAGESSDEVLPDQPWLATVHAGAIFYSDVDDSESGVPFLDMAVGVWDGNGNFAGTLVAQLDLTALRDAVAAIKVGDSGYGYITDERGQVLAYSDMELVRQGTVLRDITGRDPDEIRSGSLASTNPFNAYSGLNGGRVVGDSQQLEVLPWYVVVEQPLSETLRNLLPAVLGSLGLMVLAGVMVVSALRYTRRQVINPLAIITEGAQRFRSGDLSHRITTTGGAELTTLAETMNQAARDLMVSREALEEANLTLEDRVEQRTRDLLLTLQVGQLTTRELQTPDLLPRLAEYIREQFGLYYTQIYLVDHGMRYAILHAGTGEVGQQLLERNHRLDMDAMAIVTRAARTRQPVLVSDTVTSDIHLPNPLLPETRSELAVPLVLGDEVLGVLDMQAREPNKFTPENLPAFEAMGNQLATAMSNARTYAEVQSAIHRADTIMRRLTYDRWESYLGRVGAGERVGFVYDLTSIEALSEIDRAYLAALIDDDARFTLSRPVTLRNQSVGRITVKEDRQRTWTAEETSLIEEVASRVAQAVEQFRAFDETDRRARDLQTVAAVSTDVSTSLDIEQLLWDVANITKERFGLYHTHVYQMGEDGRSLRLAAGAGDIGRMMVNSRHTIAADSARSLVARAARERQPVVVNDVLAQEDFLPNPMLPNTRSEMSLPLTFGGEVLGVLDVQAAEIGRFTDEDVAVMSTLAAQIAVAMNNARLFDETDRRARDLQMVAAVSADVSTSLNIEQLLWDVANVTKERFGLYHTQVYLLDQDDEILRLAAGAGDPGRAMVDARHVIAAGSARSLVARAARERQPVMVNDVLAQEDFLPNPMLPNTRSEMSLPLIVGGQLLGVLDVQAAEVGRFTDEEVAVMSTLAAQIAVAVNNAQLFTQSAQRLAIIENADSLIVLLDLDGRPVYLNPAGAQMLGLDSSEQALGGDVPILGDAELAESEILPAVMQGDMWRGENRIERTDGTTIPVEQAVFLIRDEQRRPRFVASIMTDITERIRSQMQIAEQARRLALLNEMAAEMSQALDEAGVYQVVAGMVTEIFPRSRASVSLLASDEQTLQVHMLDSDEGAVPLGSRLAADSTLLSVIVQERRPLIIRDVTEVDYPETQVLAGEGVRSTLHALMTIGDEVVGTLNISSADVDAFDPADASLLSQIGSLLASNLQNQHLLSQTQKRAAEMQTVAEVGVEAATSLDTVRLLKHVSNLAKERFGLYHMQVYLLDDTGALQLVAGAGEVGEQMVASGHRIAATAQRSLAAQAVQRRETVVVNDVYINPSFLPNPMLPFARAEMAIPMIVGGQVLGVMDVQADRTNAFTDEDVLVQSTLASQVAVAVQNARLYGEQVEVAEQLREVDRLKSEFLASMSHELRTPLNSIIGYAEVLLDGIDGELNDDMEEDVGAIHSSGKHLLSLINDVLDLAKIEAGQMDLLPEPFDMTGVIDDMINTSRVLVRDKPVELRWAAPVEPLMINGDVLRVRQILNNLLTNAIKFTEEGSITVAAQADSENSDMIRVSVSDTGIGLQDDQVLVIFDRFRQVDQSHTRRAGGTGLGLSITRQLVELHGGRIWVDSAVGAGSTFFFTLPVARETALAE